MIELKSQTRQAKQNVPRPGQVLFVY